MLRFQKLASMLRATGLAVLFTLLTAGCASAQTFCFTIPTNVTTSLDNLLGTTCSVGPSSSSYVTYTWNAAGASTPGYVCTSDSGTTCPQAKDINVSIADNGCSADDGYSNYETYALLFVQNKNYLNQTYPTLPPQRQQQWPHWDSALDRHPD